MRVVTGCAGQALPALDIAFGAHERVRLVRDQQIFRHRIGKLPPIGVTAPALLDPHRVPELRGIHDRAGARSREVLGACAVAMFAAHTRVRPGAGVGRAVTAGRLLELFREARGIVERVRVIPQVHKIMGVK